MPLTVRTAADPSPTAEAMRRRSGSRPLRVELLRVRPEVRLGGNRHLL
jgi:hypothetical protein